MQFIADFHIHSKYSRATSKLTDIGHLYVYSKFKGIDILGTGDFTHPQWFNDLKTNLKLEENGLYTIKDGVINNLGDKNLIELNNIFKKKIYFMPTAEIACIFKDKDKNRRLHIVLIASSLESVEKLNRKLAEIGNIHSDGRPILGIHAKKLLEICLNIDK
ncbi:MAG TPA: DNA helicase UvrD, partial [bacterium]|nr:DNA helicase UvrD [bacterium]